MKRFIVFIFAAALCFAQRGQQLLISEKISAVSYTGPGDIITTSTIAWWGLRAWSTATRGNAAANVCDSGDAHCVDALTDATTGNLIVPSSNPNCGSSACTVKKLYDQTAGGNCGGSCDLVQATEANRPVLTTSCIGSLTCMTWNGSQILVSAGNFVFSGGSPYTMSGVAIRNTGHSGNFMGTGNGALQVVFGGTANQVFIYAGNQVINNSVPDGAFHAIQSLFNGASSALYIDGVNTAGDSGGSGATSPLCLGQCNGGFTGSSTEGGMWSADKSANFSALNSNQHTYWGF
jgi:hypothetical protein